MLFVVIVAAIQYTHYLQLNEAKAQIAEADTTHAKRIIEVEKSTARANMQTIANAE